MNPAACSWRVSTSLIFEPRSELRTSRFSSPGIAKIYSTPSLSSARTSRSEPFVIAAFPGTPKPGDFERNLSGLAPRQFPARPGKMAGVAVRVTLEIILMLRLGLPEIRNRRQFRHHLAGPQAGGLDVGDGVLGDLKLLQAGVENRRAVAGADVVALPVAGGGVVDLEEELQQVAKADDARIEHDLDRLGMVAVVAVGRVPDLAAGIADPGGNHARPPRARPPNL